MRRAIGDVSASTPVEGTFVATCRSIADRDVGLYRITVDAESIERPASQTHNGHHLIHAIFPLSGAFHIEQGGRTIVLGPGDWGLYDPTLSFRSVCSTPVEFLVLAARRGIVLGRDINFHSCTTQRFSSEKGGAHVAKTFLTSVLDEVATLSPLIIADLASVATQLLRVSIVETLDRHAGKRTNDVMEARIRAYIDRNLRNPDLSVAVIADSLNCSKRYVHKVFSRNGQSVSQFILRTRLERCFRDLCYKEFRHLSITEIAFSWGFNSQAHFSHAFRTQFNISPSGCRAKALAYPPSGSGPGFSDTGMLGSA